ncbi:MAG TPA: MAPEG family protein [Pseudolabrys sp.]|nr:MAPEG family protein [Pseudolabrys sp.]
MSMQAILLPLFVEVALTLGLLVWLGVLRGIDLRTEVVRPSEIALRQPNWPTHTLKVAYCFNNQFELPVLFYVLTILEIVTRQADIVFVVLAWVFVLSRLAHAYEHTHRNIVSRRGAIYGVGLLALLAMWIGFAFRILTAGA